MFSSFKRLSFSRMISTGLTSRDCLKELFILLKKESVVFDDPCSIFTSRDRKTLFHKIKEKFPKVKIIIYRFTGNIRERTNFFFQYRVAENFPNDFFTYDPSFEKVEPVKRDEGYDEIKFENNLPLVFDRIDFEMNHHALILDVDTISEFLFSSDSSQPANRMKRFIEFWINSRTNVRDGVSVGRVIFLKIYPSKNSEKWRNSEDVDLRLVRFISSLQLSNPIYYLPVRPNCQPRKNVVSSQEEDEDDDDDDDEDEENYDDYYTKSPNYGILPFLHYLFSLNLDKSILVHRFLANDNSSEIHSLVKHFLNCGVRVAKTGVHPFMTQTNQTSFDIFLHRNIYNARDGSPPQTIYPFFKEMKYDSSMKNPVTPHPKIYPLISTTSSYEDNNNSYKLHFDGKGHQVYVIWDRSRHDISDLFNNNSQSNEFYDHYMFYSGFQISKHFPVSLNVPIEEEEEEDGILLSDININENNNKKQQQQQQQQDFVMNELFSMYDTSSPKNNDDDNHHAKEESIPNVISLEYIIEYFGLIYFQRGRDYFVTGKIIDLKTENNNDDEENTSTITSKCRGSLDEPYEQETTLKDGKIVSPTKCTCPVSENCKHCCAQLLQNFTKDRDMETNLKPISFLNLDPIVQNRNWCIKGIVVKKYGVRNYFNPMTTSGRVSSVVLKDSKEEKEEGDEQRIRVVMFNETLDKFHHKFRVGCLYLVSRGHLRPVNENFNRSSATTTSKYDVMLHSESEVKQLTFLNWGTDEYDKFSKLMMSPAQFFKNEFQKRMNKSSHVEYVEEEEEEDVFLDKKKPEKRKRLEEEEEEEGDKSEELPDLKRRKIMEENNNVKKNDDQEKESSTNKYNIFEEEEEEDDDDDDLFAEVE